jgi:hypothetical protein
MELHFANKKLVAPVDLESLPAVQVEQLRLSGKPVFGIDAKNATETLAETFAAEFDELGCAELWQVLEGQHLRFDCWVFNADTAMVFEANTLTDTGIGMIQFDFEILVKSTPELEALRDALDVAFRNAPNDETEVESPLGAYKQAVKNSQARNETE